MYGRIGKMDGRMNGWMGMQSIRPPPPPKPSPRLLEKEKKGRDETGLDRPTTSFNHQQSISVRPVLCTRIGNFLGGFILLAKRTHMLSSYQSCGYRLNYSSFAFLFTTTQKLNPISSQPMLSSTRSHI